MSATAIYAQKRIYIPIDEVYEAYVNASYVGAYNGKPPQGNITVKNVNTEKELVKIQVESFNNDEFIASADDILSVDEQDWIMTDDYNFDGIADLAITNGQLNYDDSYKYQVYLGTKEGGLEFNPDFTEIMSQGGTLTTDQDKKELRFEFENDEDDELIVDVYQVKANKPILINQQ